MGTAGEVTWYIDADGDGFGDDTTQETDCWMPSGTVYVGADCDDSNALANPAMAEVYDGTDNDCDGAVDETGSFGEQQFYADGDGDGFGDADNSVIACERSTARLRVPISFGCGKQVVHAFESSKRVC